MSGITAVQGSTTINAAGVASFSVPQTGLVTGVVVVFTLTGATHAQYAWTAAAPEGAGNGFSSASASAPTLNPDQAGTWNIVLEGKDSAGLVEATYILPLVIVKVVNSVATGPLWPAYLDPSVVGLPSIGEALVCDATNGGLLSCVNSAGVVRQLGIAADGSFTFPKDVNATISQFTPTSDVAARDLLIRSQAAYPAADVSSQRVRSGIITLEVPPPAATYWPTLDGAHGFVKVKVSNANQVALGRHNSEPTAGMIWLGQAQADATASHLFSLQTEGVFGSTTVNAPSATGYIGIALQALDYFGFGYSIVDAEPGAFFFQTRAAKLFVQKRVGAHPCFDLRIVGQVPSDTATGTDRTPGNVYLETAASLAGGIEGVIGCKIAGTTQLTIGSAAIALNTAPLKWSTTLEQTTVGAAGAASAIPGAPTKWLKVQMDNGTALVVPAFLAA